MADVTLQPLTEQVADWRVDVTVDFEKRQVKNIVLSGGVSRNGHRYTDEALRDAVARYDQKPVFLDHAANVAKPFDRSVRDLVGTISQPRFVEGRIRGDIDVFDTDAGRTFLALMEGRSPAVGMSHVVLAQRGVNPQIVERIHDVVSVDAVVFPATTNGFHESDQSALPGSWEALIEQIDAQLPAAVATIPGAHSPSVRRLAVMDGVVLVEVRQPEETESRRYEFGWQFEQDQMRLALIGELTPKETIAERCQAAAIRSREQSQHTLTGLQQKLTDVITERDQLRVYQQRRHDERALDVLLESSGLPDYAVTEAFREQLRALPDERQRQRCLAERAEFLRRLNPRVVVSHSRATPNTTADTHFVRTIRGQRTSVLG